MLGVRPTAVKHHEQLSRLDMRSELLEHLSISLPPANRSLDTYLALTLMSGRDTNSLPGALDDHIGAAHHGRRTS